MKTTVVVYANSDDALLLWSLDQLNDDVEGFSVQRKLQRGSTAEKTSWIDNYAPPGVKAYQDGRHVPSDERPFRAFTWTDHEVRAGDKVRYRVVPFLAGTTAPATHLASTWSKRVTVGAPGSGAFSYSILVPEQPGVGAIGLYFHEGRLGVLYAPLICDDPERYANSTPARFIEMVRSRHGISLFGFGLVTAD